MEEKTDLNAPIEHDAQNLVNTQQPAAEPETAQIPAEETPAEETVVEEMPAEEVSGEEIPAVEVLAEGAPAEETPVEEEKAEKFTFALLWAKILAFWGTVKLTAKGLWARFMGLK